MGHLPPPAAQPRLGRQQHVLARAKLLAHERLVEPHRPQIVVPVADQHADAALAEAAAAWRRPRSPRRGPSAAGRPPGRRSRGGRRGPDSRAGKKKTRSPAVWSSSFASSSAFCGPTPGTNCTGVASTSAGVCSRDGGTRRLRCAAHADIVRPMQSSVGSRSAYKILLIRRHRQLIHAVVLRVAAVAGDAGVFHRRAWPAARRARATALRWRSAPACSSPCDASRWPSTWAATR